MAGGEPELSKPRQSTGLSHTLGINDVIQEGSARQRSDDWADAVAVPDSTARAFSLELTPHSGETALGALRR
jgi:hypothetical protein